MPSAPPQDRFHLFGESLERLGASLERRLRDAIGLVAADLEQVGQEEPNHRDRQAVYAVAAMLRIEVRADGNVAVGGVRDSLEEVGQASHDGRLTRLEQRLALYARTTGSLGHKPEVVLHADPAARHSDLVAVLSAVHAASIEEVGLEP